MEELTQKTHKAQRDAILKIINFEKAVAKGDIEERRNAEAELREVFEALGLGEELIKYLIAHIKRAAEIEDAYKEKCDLLHEVRETIRELARKV